MPPIVFVMPAQIGIAKNGGVSIRRGAPLRVERSGDNVSSRLKRTASLYSATVPARFSGGSPAASANASIVSARCNVPPPASSCGLGGICAALPAVSQIGASQITVAHNGSSNRARSLVIEMPPSPSSRIR
jgi:hypothetical protein